METPKTNTKLTLEARTKKGKDRINEQGSKWVVEAICDKILFSDKVGPWLGLRAVKNKDFFRWVHLTEDENFEVVIK